MSSNRIAMSDGKIPQKRSNRTKHSITTKNFVINSRAATNAYDFTIDFPQPLKNIQSIKFVRVSYDYVVPGSNAPRMAYVSFDNLNLGEAHETAYGEGYHASFDLQQGSASDAISATYICPTNYEVQFKNIKARTPKLHVQVFREDSTTGTFNALTDLTYLNIEMEMRFLDYTTDEYRR